MSEFRQQTELEIGNLPVPGSPEFEQANNTFAVRRFSHFSELQSVATEWDELVAKSETNTVHQLFAWNETWWRHLSDGKDLFVFSARVGNRLVGIAPLMRSVQRKHGRRCRVVEFIGSGNVNYLDFIAGRNKKQILEALLDALMKCRGEWDMLNLLHIPESSTTAAIIQEYFQLKGLTTWIVPFGGCPAYICSGDKQADLKITKKKTEQRYYNYYRKSGDFQFKICGSMDEVDAYLPAMFEQHIARFATAPRPSKYSDRAQREFVRSVTQRLLADEIPVFSVALFNGRPIAAQYGFYYAGKFTGYLLTHDAEEAKNSPGKLVVKLIMAEMIERGITEFDFGRGAGEYKMRFANAVRENKAVMAYNDKTLSLFATISHTSDKITRKAKDFVKSNVVTRVSLEQYSAVKLLLRSLTNTRTSADLKSRPNVESAATD
ncbi:MAG TPA: GNAT family N-acetyltransferase [Blastocatellia bacterium]|nr:GNAT family N-acetyltransferase [Blastocatellia bacterium]